jgi:hypothetical protein
MRSVVKFACLVIACLAVSCVERYKGVDPFSISIVNGVPWIDDQGTPVNAHGACIVEENGVYYLFGEWKSDTTNAFPGFGCYSSSDLVNWKFERVALSLQKDGLLGPNRVGERPKVMRCPQTGEYIMLAHTDDMRYKDPQVGLAVADKATISENKIFTGLVEGRVSKQLKDICLMDQTYVRAEDGKQTVAQYLESVNKDLAITRVVRFEVGEGIEKKEENFAEEVAAQMANR